MLTKEFLIKYNKSVQEGYDDYSLIDNSGTKPKKEDYKDFNEYINNLCNYIERKFRYTYGSKAKNYTQPKDSFS
tara:strand:- start:1059 stop:1280 length:222 start_codon:yes stop_codon:yes gene_type:complete